MFSVRSALVRVRLSSHTSSYRHTSVIAHARGGDAAALDADIDRALEKAERAADSWAFEVTDFYPPPVAAEVLQQVSKWADVSARTVGGHPNAERCRIVVAREELLVDEAPESDFVTALQVCDQFCSLASLLNIVSFCCEQFGLHHLVGQQLVRPANGCNGPADQRQLHV